MSSSPPRAEASPERNQQTYHSQSAGSSPPSSEQRPLRRPVFQRPQAMSSTSTIDSNSSGSSMAVSYTSSQRGHVPIVQMSPFRSPVSMPSMTPAGSPENSTWTLCPPSPGAPLAAQMPADRAPSPAGSARGRFSPPDSPPRHAGRGFTR